MVLSIFLDPIFWLQFLLFLFAVFTAFFIPGNLLVKKLNLKPLPLTVLSISVGIVLWAWQGLIFGYANMRWLSYAYLLLCFFLWIKDRGLKISNLKQRFKKNSIDQPTLLLLITGAILQTVIIFFNGTYIQDILYFCCGEGRDNSYHLELTNAIISRIPPYEQLMYGIEVKNYHYWANIVIAELVRVFHLDLLKTLFQFMPLLVSFFLGLLGIVISQLLNLPKTFSRFLLFFLYFGGDFIYILQLLFTRTIDFSMGPIENGTSLLMNPPRAFAAIIFLAGLSLLIVWVKKKDFLTGFLAVFVLSSVIGFKVYVGIFTGAGLASLGVYYLYRRDIKMIAPLLLYVALSAIIFLPVNKSSGGLFWAGFWRFENFIVHPKLGLVNLELARQIYASHNNWLRVYFNDLLYVALYIFGQFGTKIIGFFQTKKSFSSIPKEVHIVLIAGMTASFLLGGFFFQKTGLGNEFNFIVNIYIIGSIYSALAAWHLTNKLKNSAARGIFITLLIVLTLPRILFEEHKYLSYLATFDGYKIGKSELSAMQYLREKTDPSALVFPYNTQYLTALGKRSIAFADNGVADLHGVIVSRKDAADTILQSEDPKKVLDMVKKYNISYLYFPRSKEIPSLKTAPFLKRVFTSESIQIIYIDH